MEELLPRRVVARARHRGGPARAAAAARREHQHERQEHHRHGAHDRHRPLRRAHHALLRRVEPAELHAVHLAHDVPEGRLGVRVAAAAHVLAVGPVARDAHGAALVERAQAGGEVVLEGGGVVPRAGELVAPGEEDLLVGHHREDRDRLVRLRRRARLRVLVLLQRVVRAADAGDGAHDGDEDGDDQRRHEEPDEHLGGGAEEGRDGQRALDPRARTTMTTTTAATAAGPEPSRTPRRTRRRRGSPWRAGRAPAPGRESGVCGRPAEGVVAVVDGGVDVRLRPGRVEHGVRGQRHGEHARGAPGARPRRAARLLPSRRRARRPPRAPPRTARRWRRSVSGCPTPRCACGCRGRRRSARSGKRAASPTSRGGRASCRPRGTSTAGA